MEYAGHLTQNLLDTESAGCILTLPNPKEYTMLTIDQLAKVANGYLTRIILPENQRTRTDYRIVQAENCPQWFTDICYSAHDGKIPNDWSYEFIHDALNSIEEGSDEEENLDLDSLYPYTADRLNWLSSHLERPGYCDEAQDQWGSNATRVLDIVALGMAYELQQVYSTVWNGLTERLELLNSDPLELLDFYLTGLDLTKFEGLTEQAVKDAEEGEWTGVLALADRVQEMGDEERAKRLREVAQVAVSEEE